MRYFHRTSLSLDEVLAEADRFLGGKLNGTKLGSRETSYSGSMGNVVVKVAAEGGHYTLVTVSTDKVGESEIDKLAKRFLTLVHSRVDESHVVRGSY